MHEAMGNDNVKLCSIDVVGPVISNWPYRKRLQMDQGKPNASADIVQVRSSAQTSGQGQMRASRKCISSSTLFQKYRCT
jgi:hypothetical protein